MDGIVFWTPYICMHSSSVYEELGKTWNVIIACQSKEYGTFGGLNLRHVQIIQIFSKQDVDNLIRRTQKFIHINGSIKWHSNSSYFTYALHRLLHEKCFVMSVNQEQYQWWGFKGMLRRLQWFYLFNIGIGRKIKAIGCTGATGVMAHRKAFVSKKRLFDFIYSVPPPNSHLIPIDGKISLSVQLKNNNVGGGKICFYWADNPSQMYFRGNSNIQYDNSSIYS